METTSNGRLGSMLPGDGPGFGGAPFPESQPTTHSSTNVSHGHTYPANEFRAQPLERPSDTLVSTLIVLVSSATNVLDARRFILNDVTVNDAEYYGLLKGLSMAIEHDIQDLVVVGDSRIVIQQDQGLINCHQPNLQRTLAEYEVLKEYIQMLKLVHVMRDFNQAVDYLTSKTLALDKPWIVQEPDERRHLEVVSKFHEQLMKSPLVIQEVGDGGMENPNDTLKNDPDEAMPGPACALLPPAARVMAVLTRPAAEEALEERPAMGPLEYQAERRRRIKAHQDQEDYIVELKAFLKGDLDRFPPRRLRKVAFRQSPQDTSAAPLSRNSRLAKLINRVWSSPSGPCSEGRQPAESITLLALQRSRDRGKLVRCGQVDHSDGTTVGFGVFVVLASLETDSVAFCCSEVGLTACCLALV
ncbi:unnamed protein product [Phytophthora fragariaefolia]|uniref:Unnamed protein product n=1 Tax=Phytophthora fragariaefolia TaxID=1490495 RepID=A0A9W6XRF7_9STRA|nr:unnamed protein product [Phytophthora fragariaefolia]